MLSLIRHGQLGLPLPRIQSMATALGLDAPETEAFIRLVRSTQAKRAIQRGSSYVDEIEVELSQARALIGDFMSWATAAGHQVPQPLTTRARTALGITSGVLPSPERARTSAHARACPWSERPQLDTADRDRIEARNAIGKPIAAEYRIRIRDAEGLLMHGDILVVPGVNAVLENIQQRYAQSEFGAWPPGWYACEFIRKAVPDACISTPLYIPEPA